MKQKLYIVLAGFIFLSGQAIAGEWSGFAFAKYSKEFSTHHRIDLLHFIGNRNKKNYALEMSFFTIPWTTHDPFNNGVKTLAFTPMLQVFSLAAAGIYTGIARDSTDRLWSRAAFLNALISSKHHFFLKRKRPAPLLYGIPDGISLFFKHNFDIYIPEKKENQVRKIWFNFSPGIGINLHKNNFQLQFGFTYNYQTDFKKHYKVPYIFFGFSWYGQIM